eukprot:COSAG01_NODE_2469_length_7630_cov_3.588555_3_plen_205_part_00
MDTGWLGVPRYMGWQCGLAQGMPLSVPVRSFHQAATAAGARGDGPVPWASTAGRRDWAEHEMAYTAAAEKGGVQGYADDSTLLNDVGALGVGHHAYHVAVGAFNGQTVPPDRVVASHWWSRTALDTWGTSEALHAWGAVSRDITADRDSCFRRQNAGVERNGDTASVVKHQHLVHAASQRTSHHDGRRCFCACVPGQAEEPALC